MTVTATTPPIPALASLTWLSATEVSALEAYCDALVRALGREYVKSVILYGSKARGDAHAYSDVDLLVILDPGDEMQQSSECKVVSQIKLDYGIGIESLAQSASFASEMQRIGSPLMQNVSRDGIVLLGAAVTVNPIETKRFVKDYIDAAKERLVSAQLLLKGRNYRDSVSRSYYACLDAADAALIASGVVPKSHKGTLSLFSEKLIKTKLVDERYKDVFETLQKARLSADYERGAHVTQAAAADALMQAQAFVTMIEQFLPTLLK